MPRNFLKTVVALIAIAFVMQAHAGSCARPPLELIAQHAQIAFTGTVTAIEDHAYEGGDNGRKWGPQCGGKLVTFRVSDRIRGNPASSVTVVSQDACYLFGLHWKAGSSYLIVAKPKPDHTPGQFIDSGVCGGSMELGEEADTLIKALRGAKP